ncbi:MAG TPA: glycosyltransferase family 4 protein [Candidatus Limnocylindrales bacterium]|nr:glycosyltransferase family 4 protein [Candidatus Limnocylindrales bacterium]
MIELQHVTGYTARAQALIRGITTGYYTSWLSKSAGIDWDAYCLVYLEYSRHGFIARQAKKHSKKIVVRVHNVEKDYYLTARTNRKSIKDRLRASIKLYFIAKQESCCLASADCVVCLTDSDKERLKKLYPDQLQNCRLEVIPVSIEQPSDYSNPSPEFIKRIEENPYLLITGSLWFEPNAGGATWFIKNVWHRLQASDHQISSKYKLVIAGSKPGKEIKSLVARYKNIELIDTPLEMKPYFENASIYLAPIFTGTGMKVKVAEALSYGLPVIGTNHAFTGYMITDRENGYQANNADGFIDSLEHYTSLPDEAKINIRAEAYKNFKENHCIESSTNNFERIIGSME